MKIAFIGHRQIFVKDIVTRLYNAVENEVKNGRREFIMGIRGKFDRFALSVCRALRNYYTDINIEVVVTSKNAIKRYNFGEPDSFEDVKTIMYDIDSAYYKQRITLSNRQMIKECDTLICYVNTAISGSGASSVLRYAVKMGLRIINLYDKKDTHQFDE